MNLTTYIAQFCQQNNVSKEKLAKYANLSRSSLYRMLEDDATPTLVNLTKLAIAMQVHPQYLIKLEWDKYQLSGYDAKPIKTLKEPKRWFNPHKDDVHFISETVADGSIVSVNERFTKTWRLQNTGDTVWKDRRLQCQDSKKVLTTEPNLKRFSDTHNFNLRPASNYIDIPTTKPGDKVDLSIEMIAPGIPASVFSYWKMIDIQGELCFPDSIGVYVTVQVVSGGSACV